MRRSERLPAMTKMLVDRPNQVISLSEFTERFGAAKSTVSEDLAIVKGVFADQGLGRIETLAGAAGGVKFVPATQPADVRAIVEDMCRDLSDARRILPGGFLYMSDLVSSPRLMSRIGEVFATQFVPAAPTVVVTLETSGIPVALMTARALDVPLAIVRRTSRVTEGSVVTMNYVSGSAKRIETMSLSRRALSEGSRVLIVDDFMKAGGSARGLVDLVEEFGAETVGIGILVETGAPRQKLVKEYVSLAVLESVDEERRFVHVRPSDWVNEINRSPEMNLT